MIDFLLSPITFVLAYAVICLLIGWWSGHNEKDNEYMIVGRSLGTWSFVATVVASYIGGGAIVAYTAYVYQFGISAVTVYLGTAVGYVVFIWYALRLKRKSDEQKFHTLADWFYYKTGKKAGLTVAILVFIYFFGALANQFIASTSILVGLSGWSYGTALTFSVLVVFVYLVVGGMKSVLKTDIFQYVIFLITLIVIAVALYRGTAIAPQLLEPGRLGIVLTISFIIYGVCQLFSSADLWQRIYAAKDEKVVRRGLWISAGMVLGIGILLSMIGLAAASAVPNAEPTMAAVIGLLQLLPASLSGIVLVMVFAAVMSTADTLIFTLASSVAKDWLARKRGEDENDEKILRAYTKWAIVAITGIGFLVAYFFRDIIDVLVVTAGLGFALVPSVIGTFHFKLHEWAIISSIIASAVYVLGLIIVGILTPEAAVASLFVALVVLFVTEYVLRFKERHKSMA